MFKDYLYTKPKGFQLATFLFLWSCLFLLAATLQMFMMKYYFGSSNAKELSGNALLEHPSYVITANAIYSLLVFGVPAFIFAYIAHPKAKQYLGIKKPHDSKLWKWSILLALGLIPIVLFMGHLINQLDLGEAAKKLQETQALQMKTYLGEMSILKMVANLFLLALIPAVFEELFFRGIIQKFAFSYTKNMRTTILISAIAFSLMHASVYNFLPILFAGIVLAWIYQNTQSMWLNILVHFLFNGIQIVLVYIAAESPAFNDAAENVYYIGAAAIIGILLLFFAIKNIYQLRNPYPSTWGVEGYE